MINLTLVILSSKPFNTSNSYPSVSIFKKSIFSKSFKLKYSLSLVILIFKVSYNFNCSSFSAKIIKAESFTKNMCKGEGTSRELPEGWIDFDPNSVTYNLAKYVCDLSK